MAYSPLNQKRPRDGASDDLRTSYTSEFVESVADLPIELKKSYSLIKDLDEYVHEMMDGRPSAETPGVEEMKQQMLTKARRVNETGKGTMDKAGLEIMKKQWGALQAQEQKVLEIAAEKCQLAAQTQRHIQNHMARLETIHGKFEKELAKSDPEGLAEVLQRESEYVPKPVKQPTQRRKKQPTKFDLVGKWVAIEYDDDSATAASGDGAPPQKVYYNGLVMAYDDNLHSYLISWEVGGEEWIDDLKDGEYAVVSQPV